MVKNDLQGALDLLVLKTLSQLGSMHGYGIVMHIRLVSGNESSWRRVPCTRS
jgi:DNA-binding PadR family transcriptional regulator